MTSDDHEWDDPASVDATDDDDDTALVLPGFVACVLVLMALWFAFTGPLPYALGVLVMLTMLAIVRQLTATVEGRG